MIFWVWWFIISGWSYLAVAVFKGVIWFWRFIMRLRVFGVLVLLVGTFCSAVAADDGAVVEITIRIGRLIINGWRHDLIAYSLNTKNAFNRTSGAHDVPSH